MHFQPAGDAAINTKALLKDFFKKDASSGILLVLVTILALIAANSPLSAAYQAVLDAPIQIRIGPVDIHKPLILWINDGLMAIFFLLVGLEVKREMLQGELSSLPKLALPGLAAVGGMLVPALFYAALNFDSDKAMQGWAIPAATDIAFALGILSLLGNRVPTSLKLFLLTLAILDDLGAIVIIAIFYTSDLSLGALGLAGFFLATLFALNRFGIRNFSPYVLLGILLWICVLKSGVHATLAGVALAFTIPLRTGEEHPPLARMEHGLHAWVYFLIMPIFAFANAGVPLAGIRLGDLLAPIPLGIAGGLFVGKQLGIFLFSFLAVKSGLAQLPEGQNWKQLYALGILCGIGFTMSLFIASLSFDISSPLTAPARLGILLGSTLSGLVGYVLLRKALPDQTTP